MIKKVCIGYGNKEGKCSNETVNIKKSPFCRNCAGKNFEDQIANLFKVQGYTVMQNITASGTQNDFFAELQYGITRIGVLVECKFKFEQNKTVDSEDVRKFEGSWKIFNGDKVYGIAHKAYLITNATFAPEAIEVSKKLGIELYTEFELLKNLINFEPYLKELVYNYKNSHLYKHYIELYSTSGDYLIDDIKDTLFESGENALVILGDYGCGKTSLCTKLSYELAEKILRGEEAPLPIYIRLRDYNKAFDIEELITNMLINKLNILNGNFNTFVELVKHGHILMIFDGFDEIARRVDYSVKLKVFNEICRFATSNSKIIVTCRPNFFNQRKEFERIFKSSPLYFEPNISNVEFAEIQIDDLNISQIKQYIISYGTELSKKGFAVIDFLKIIKNTHDLWDLAKRPVLLNVIIETIPKLNIEKGKKINSARLYEEYTSFWLEREDDKGKTLINSSQKILFTKELALEMFLKNELTINYMKLPNTVKEYFNISDLDEIDHFSQDIQSCSFLNTEGDGNFKFIHKSFMEYFVAFKILSELVKLENIEIPKKIKKINGLLGSCFITLEIGLFIKDLFDIKTFNENEIIAIFKSFEIKSLSIIARKNVLSIISKTSVNLIDTINEFEDLEGADISNAVIKNGIISSINFDGVNFYKTKIENVKFEECSFVDSIFRKSFINKVFFDISIFETSDFSYSQIYNSSMKGASFAYCNFKNTKITNCDFDMAELTEIEYNEKTSFISCKNLDNTIGRPYFI